MNARLRYIGATGMLLCRDHGAFIVGSGALWLVDEAAKKPNDWDFVLPPANYARAVSLMPQGCSSNQFGGLRWTGDEINPAMDIWPMELGEHFKCLPPGFPAVAFNPCFGVVLRMSRIGH